MTGRIERALLKVAEPGGLHSFRHEAMATEFVFSFGGVDAAYAQAVAQEAFRLVDDVESKLSLYRESSDVSRINLAKLGQMVTVSSTCIACLELAMQASSLSGERFRILVGREACAAKGQAPAHLRDRLERLEDTDSDESEGSLAVDPVGRQVTRLKSSALVDLGGIGKGFALDQVMEMLEDWEVPVVALNSGGSTHLFRSSESGLRWEVELGSSRLAARRDGALASSGLGFQDAHIIDPRTGSARTRWHRSYVSAPSAGLADALSTAAMLMDWSELRALAAAEPALSFAVEAADGGVLRGGYFETEA